MTTFHLTDADLERLEGHTPGPYSSIRPSKQWAQIYREQTDGSPEGVAKRILGDLVAYRSETQHKDVDIAQLASALNGYCSPLLADLKAARAECFALAANQCHDGIAGEFGHHICNEQVKLRAQIAELERLISNRDLVIAAKNAETAELVAALELIRDRLGIQDDFVPLGVATEVALVIDRAIRQGRKD